MIVDLYMPEEDGLETIQELRGKRPEAKIIAMTGAPPGLKVQKPFLADEVIDAVNKVLKTA